MTLSAHIVPVKEPPCPVKDMIRGNVIIRMKVKPALSTLLPGVVVPTDVGHLYPPVRKLDHILLERVYTKNIGDLIIMKLTIASVGSDKKLSIFFVKR
jgi:hypothetical protein